MKIPARFLIELFQPENRHVSEWLHQCYGLHTNKISGETEIQVHPSRRKHIIEELKAAGFEVAVLCPLTQWQTFLTTYGQNTMRQRQRFFP